jgi:hypothetical protein
VPFADDSEKPANSVFHKRFRPVEPVSRSLPFCGAVMFAAEVTETTAGSKPSSGVSVASVLLNA